jgi:nitrate/nitrite transporter NarK
MADYFGTTSFGAINGVAMFIGTAGAFFGPLAVGIGVDLTGSYTPGWLISMAVSVIAIPAILLALPPTELITRYRARGQQIELSASPAPRFADAR